MKQFILDYNENNNTDINKYIKNLNLYIIGYISWKFSKENKSIDREKYIDLWDKIISDNLWIEYFLKNSENIKTNWIDFEKEILFVVSRLEQFINKPKIIESLIFLEKINYEDSTRNLKILLDTYKKPFGEFYETIKFDVYSFITKLEKDLEKLIFALELYISDFVNKIKIRKYSYDISQLEFDKVLSFNYSNTYESYYDNLDSPKHAEYDYIHGKAISHIDYDENELVLGINEYLPDNEKDKNIRFIRFKKFFQRIHKNTGCHYKNWIEDINRTAHYTKHYLFIFGHSLDDTDRDILRELILNDNIITTIFYHNREAYAQQITNLVKVIGQDELIRKTGGSKTTLFFAEQSPMIEGTPSKK